MNRPGPAPEATRKTLAYAALAGSGLLAAVVLGDVAIVALAAPFAFCLVIGLLLAPPPLPEIVATLERERILEGESTTLTLEVSSRERLRRCSIALDLGELTSPAPTQWWLGLEPDQSLRLEVPLVAGRYGHFSIGPTAVRVQGVFGMLVRDGLSSQRLPLEVRPKAESLRTLVRALEVRATAGDRLGRRPSDGIEFAELRPYAPGTPGRINWRVTARRGEPYVSLRHPERSTDLILLVDSFSADSLQRQVRAAAGLAAAALSRHDRVGLVAFGGVLHWVEPHMGLAQLERVLAALIATQWHHSYAWKSAEIIPARALPPTGLVIALSPLEDTRMLHALAAIRAKGVDLAIIETSVARVIPVSEASELAARIIALERAEMRRSFARRGVPVIFWREGDSLEVPLGALALWRRRARRRAAR